MRRAPFLKVGLDQIKRKENKKRLYFILKLILFVALIFIQVKYPNLKKDYGIISVGILRSVLFYVTFLLIISLSRLILVYFYLKRHQLKDDFKDNFIIGIDHIVDLLSVLAFFIAILFYFDIDLRSLFTSVSIVAAALAIIFKEYISNVINSLILMFSDQLSINDRVKIKEHKGKVVDITLINLHLLNEEDDLVYIPNNMVLSVEVINYSKQSNKKITIEFNLDPGKVGNLKQLESFLRPILNNFKQHIREDSIRLKVTDILAEGIKFKLQFTLTKPNKEMERTIKKDISDKILEYIDQNSLINPQINLTNK